jgi:hypothetical protein
MNTWDHIEPILINIQEIIKQKVPDLADQLYTWVMPGLAIQNDPTQPDIARVVMGTKSYQDMQFPLCCIMLRHPFRGRAIHTRCAL